MVRLVPMGEEEYREYAEFSVSNYAQQQIKAGVWNQEDALQSAEKAFRSLLPDGLVSRGQSLYIIVDEELDRRNETRGVKARNRHKPQCLRNKPLAPKDIEKLGNGHHDHADDQGPEVDVGPPVECDDHRNAYVEEQPEQEYGDGQVE